MFHSKENMSPVTQLQSSVTVSSKTTRDVEMLIIQYLLFGLAQARFLDLSHNLLHVISEHPLIRKISLQ
jgi:hypothetical protein